MISGRIGIDSPGADVCPNVLSHPWGHLHPTGWRHASVGRSWVVQEPMSVVLIRHGDPSTLDGTDATVLLEPGTRLRYDVTEFLDSLEFGAIALYHFRVESGAHAGRCFRMSELLLASVDDSEVSPARLGLRSQMNDLSSHAE